MEYKVVQSSETLLFVILNAYFVNDDNRPLTNRETSKSKKFHL